MAQQLFKLKEPFPKPLYKDIDNSLTPPQFQNVNETVTINGNAYTLPFIIIPKNTTVFRGIPIECSQTKDSFEEQKLFLYVAIDKKIAKFYSGGYCIASYKTLRDLKLLDLWNGDTFKMVDKEIKDIYDKIAIEIASGRINKSDDFLSVRTVDSFYRIMFPDGKFEIDEYGHSIFKYKGLIWGPKTHMFKRNSQQTEDIIMVTAISRLIPKLDGIYGSQTPSHVHSTIYNIPSMFHSEIIIKTPFANDDKKLQLLNKNVGGRKTLKLKSRKIFRKKTVKK